MKILMIVMCLVLGFFSGFLSLHYKSFPYKQVRYVKNIISPKNKVVTSLYKDRKSFFEEFRSKSDIVMIGDSITFRAEWGEVLPGVLVINRGIGGDTVKGVLNRFDSIKSTEASKAFIMIGVNDVINDHPVKEIYAQYSLLVNKLKESNITPYIQSTLYVGKSLYPLNKRIGQLNQKLKELSINEGVAYIDVNTKLAPNDLLGASFTSDDIHMNGRGYLLWKDMILPYVYE